MPNVDEGNEHDANVSKTSSAQALGEQAVIFVPVANPHSLIRRGSAVVSTQTVITGRVVVDVEDGPVQGLRIRRLRRTGPR